MVDLSKITKGVIESDVSNSIANKKAALDEVIANKDMLDKGPLPKIEEVGGLFL